MSQQHQIHAEPLREFATNILQQVGLPKNHADDAAEVMLWASLRGVDTHGIRNLKRYYVNWLLDGTLNPQPEFQIEYETPISARADGDRGIGLAGACWGMRLAIEKAADAGVGFVSMRNSHHLGAAGCFAHMAVEHDMIGMCTTGFLFANGNDTGVLPVFGMRPMLSTNPLAVAFPSQTESPFVLDMATSAVPFNRVELMQERGESIPPGWGFDVDGNPTTDPAAIRQLQPLGGSREQGGHKGYGLAMIVEILSAVLSGGWRPQAEVQQPTNDESLSAAGYTQEGIAHFFGAVRIDLFRSPAEFRKGMDALICTMNASPPAPEHDRVYVAGQIEHETQQRRRQSGIPIAENILADLRELSETYNVPLP